MTVPDRGKFHRYGGEAARFYFETGSMVRVRQLLIDKYGTDADVALWTLHNWKHRGRWHEVRAEMSNLENEAALLEAFEGRIESMAMTLSACVTRLRNQVRTMKDGSNDK